MTGPCTPYLTSDDVDITKLCGTNPPDAEMVDEMLGYASSVMFVLTARQFPGACTSTVRPCRDTDCWCGCPCGCDCMTDAVILPVNTIGVSEVRIDGVPLASSEWAIIDGDHLVRTNGRAWPSRQNLALSDDQPGTFAIDLRHGSDVPPILKRATMELVGELWLSWTSDPSCRLPASTNSVSRQGLSFSLENTVEQVRESGPALPGVALALGIYNPSNQRLPSDVLNPYLGWTLHRSSRDTPSGVIDAEPEPVALRLYEGDDFDLHLAVTTRDGQPVDLTGATPRAEIRRSDDSLLATFDATINGNVVELHLPGSATVGLPSSAVWDCQVTYPGGAVSTIASGPVAIAAEVTQ